eukprot:CAMPEP_0196570376 /NCGR_PEP_ID=MMETSP1081-20130531/439_1 /TAXON_ID=36882 /ORGANISM="Pyramimonas amylifera, Strain CCMP720" /LENGTH=326 /DNA_ID=CAMNT_0041886779 /DNA_START=316 /DNA_END=1296 /DNA_ORIENTATION=-
MCTAAKEKVAIVTGANTGMGKVTAAELARKGYSVVMACRSVERGEEAAEKLRLEYAADPDMDSEGRELDLRVLRCDLADLASVQEFTGAFTQLHQHCDVLVNNAGIMAPPIREETKDGFELQLGVNHLGHFALTAGLMDSLQAAEAAHIVNTSSSAHLFGRMNFEDLQLKNTFAYSFAGWTAYGQSKLANVLFTYELHRRLRQAGITNIYTNAVHPGVVDTELARYLPLDFFSVMKQFGGLITPEQGARGQIRLASEPELANFSGRYFSELSQEGKAGRHEQRASNPASYSLEDARRLWEVSSELTGAQFKIVRAKDMVSASDKEL